MIVLTQRSGLDFDLPKVMSYRASVTELHLQYCDAVGTCRYFDPETVGLDFEGMCSDLDTAPEGSIIVLHGRSA